jgi:hypothetical protein
MQGSEPHLKVGSVPHVRRDGQPSPRSKPFAPDSKAFTQSSDGPIKINVLQLSRVPHALFRLPSFWEVMSRPDI